MSLRVPTRADLEDKARLLDVLRGLYDAIGTNRYSLTQITNRLVNVEGATSDANVWLSQPNAGFPSGVDLGLRGTGVLQQTVTAGVATPQAVPLVTGNITHGGTDSLIAQDHRFYWDEASGSLWLRQFNPGPQVSTISTTFATNETSLLIRADGTQAALTLETGTSVTSQGPAFQLRGNFYPSFHDWASVQRARAMSFSYDGSGGNDSDWGVFKVNLKSNYEFNGNTSTLPGSAALDSFSWRGVTHRVGGSNNTNTDGVNFHAFFPGTLLSAPDWSAENSATVAIYGPTTFTPVDGSVGTIGAVYGLRITGAGHIDRTDGTWEWRTGSTSPVSPSGSGRIRYNESLSRMEFSENGSAYAPFGTGGGTVTAVTASSPLASSGGTTPNITHLTTAVTPGSYTFTSLTVDAYGHITAASSGSTAGFVTSVSGTATRISSTGGATPVIDLVNTAVTPGSYTYGSFTVDAAGRLTAASSGATPALAARTLAATAPLLIDGGHGPLDLSANRTFSHDTSGVGAGTSDWATVQVDVYGHVTGIAAGTWPTAGRVVVSTGTDPIGYAEFTYDTAKDALRNDGPLSLNCAPDSITAGHLVTTDPTATRDRVWFGVGGVTVSDGVNREWVTIAPEATTIDTLGITLVTALRVRGVDYTLTGVAAGTIASVYADQPTFNGGNVSDPSNSAWVYYAAGGTTSQSKFEGTVIANSAAIAASLGIGAAGFHVLDTTGIKFFNVGAAVGVAQQTVTGSRVTGAALVSLLAAGAAYGLWVDATTP